MPCTSLRRFAKFGNIFRTNVLFNPMVVVTDETEVERLLKVQLHALTCALETCGQFCAIVNCASGCRTGPGESRTPAVVERTFKHMFRLPLHVQAEHKLVESAWPTSMRNLLGPNSILTANKQQHKQQRQILSQV